MSVILGEKLSSSDSLETLESLLLEVLILTVSIILLISILLALSMSMETDYEKFSYAAQFITIFDLFTVVL